MFFPKRARIEMKVGANKVRVKGAALLRNIPEGVPGNHTAREEITCPNVS
jgi:hypothetical protein